MTRSVYSCKNCGSAALRRSRIHSKFEWVQTFFGRYPFRCLRCQYRFTVRVWFLHRLVYAKCPRCLRGELHRWPARTYHLPFWKKLLVTLGAHRYRCAACRYRFVSFLPLEASAGEASKDFDGLDNEERDTAASFDTPRPRSNSSL